MKLERKGMSDESIIEMYWRRDEQAIHETDVKYKKFLFAVAYNILHNTGDSEECLNDTYMGVWNSIPPTRPKMFQAYLAAIMRRIAVDCYKSRNRQKRVVSELSVSLTEVEDFITSKDDVCSEIEAKELGRVISEYVRALSQRQMYIFISRYYFVRPIKEISRLLSCSESTVNKEIVSIKKGLKEKLEKEGYSL